MKSNYKKLGPYIRVVNERNTELEVETLLGVSVKKIFIPSIANTVGTNFKKYKIVRKNQFTYIADTSRRGDKIGIAMLESHDSALVSQAYTVFEVIDQNQLSPEYLMMWFRRPEFDRYARYKSHGSVREIFDWEEMCDTELPIPSIEKQRDIVNEYNTITNRIALNEQLNKKLEETAQALYKHWFVDFEFPNEEGKPYKSSGGKMVYNEELDKEIPEGWNCVELGSIIKHKKGKAFKSDLYQNFGIPIVRVSDLTKKSVDFGSCLFIDEKYFNEFKDVELNENDIIITSVGSWATNPDSVVGKVVKVPRINVKSLLNQNMVRLRTINNELQLVLYSALSRKDFADFVISGAQGSANQASVTLDHLFSYKLCLPNIKVLESHLIQFNSIFGRSSIINSEMNTLNEIKELLLSKMTKVEVEKEIA